MTERPIPKLWAVIAVRSPGQPWAEMPGAAVPLAQVPALICLARIESRTRRDGRRDVMEVRAV